MSDFKLCIRCGHHTVGACGCDLADMEDFAEGLQTRLAAADKLLRDLEWSDFRCEGLSKCPVCKKPTYRGHAEDCKLKKYLDSAD